MCFCALVNASKAVVNQRILVRKSIFQLNSFNAQSDCGYLKPIAYLDHFKKWEKTVAAGLSEEELADIQKSKEQIEHYQKIYDIFEYCTLLHDTLFGLETRISSNNPSIPFSIYRQSKSSSVASIQPEIEEVLQAYYSLIDDCKDCPEWRVKVEKELGSTVSYLFLTMDESSRDALV